MSVSFRSRPTVRPRRAAGAAREIATDAGPAAVADTGRALIEVIVLGLLVLVPIVYVMIAVLRIQATTLAVGQAARDIGRAIDTSSSVRMAAAQADLIARTDLADQGIDADAADLQVTYQQTGHGCDGTTTAVVSVAPGAVYDICVRVVPSIPGGAWAQGLLHRNRITGEYTLHVGELREGK